MTNSGKGMSPRRPTTRASSKPVKPVCRRVTGFDSASYQAGIFNCCEETGQTFAICARLDPPTQKAIAENPESAWKQYADCAIAETVHSRNETKNAFRLVVVRHKRQAELFDDAPRYYVIASNRVESA